MKQRKLNQLALIKSILYNSYVFTPEYPRFTFFDYQLHRKQVEIFNNDIQMHIEKERKTKKKYWRWIKRIGVIILSVYAFGGVPNAMACSILQNKTAIKSIWSILLKEKETKKDENCSQLSNKILLLGGIILGLSLGAIFFHQTGMSRILFTPKLDEIPLYKLPEACYTLDEKEILKKINFNPNINLRAEILKRVIEKFGDVNFKNLLQGQLRIDYVNNEAIFTFLTAFLTNTAKLARYEKYLKGFEEIETYINPVSLKEVTHLKKILLNNLNEIIGSNPELLMRFKTIMTKVLLKVETEKSFNLSLDLQNAIINDMLTHYFRQRMLTPIQP